MIDLVAIQALRIEPYAGGDVPGVGDLVVVLQTELVGGGVLGAVHLVRGRQRRLGTQLKVVVHGELMAVVDHVVVRDVFAIAGRFVFDLGAETQAAVHSVIKFDPVGVDAVVFGVTVAVVDAG
ncbi:hypothetical protein D3C81_1619870 [compost metagenome]